MVLLWNLKLRCIFGFWPKKKSPWIQGPGGGGHSSILVYMCTNYSSKNTPKQIGFLKKEPLNKDIVWYMNISLPKQVSEILKI